MLKKVRNKTLGLPKTRHDTAKDIPTGFYVFLNQTLQ